MFYKKRTADKASLCATHSLHCPGLLSCSELANPPSGASLILSLSLSRSHSRHLPRSIEQLHSSNGRELLAELLGDRHAHCHDTGCRAADAHFHNGPRDLHKLQATPSCACPRRSLFRHLARMTCTGPSATTGSSTVSWACCMCALQSLHLYIRCHPTARTVDEEPARLTMLLGNNWRASS